MNETVTKLIENNNITDMLFIGIITIPLFIIYLIFSAIYFIKIDKVNKDSLNAGLSRFCLAGIFVMFGIILFDIIMECASAYAVYLKLEELQNSIVFSNICKSYKSVPVNILINITILCVAIYTGTEGIIASLKTLKVEEGLAVELPAKKRKRLSVMFFVWCYLSIVATVYHFLIGSETVNFDVTNFYIGLGVNLLILFLAERSPTVLQDKSTGKVVKIGENNVVSDYHSDSDSISIMDSSIEKQIESFGEATAIDKPNYDAIEKLNQTLESDNSVSTGSSIER